MNYNKLLGKINNLKVCINRIHQVYDDKRERYLNEVLIQESVLLNLQRVCDIAIDIANLIVSELDLGIPNTSRDSFELLEEANIVDPELTSKLFRMIGFRNLIVHQYIRIDLNRVADLIENDLTDMETFIKVIIKHFNAE